MNTGKCLRAAIIGCGKISRPHARAYRDVDATELVAAADISQPARDTFAAEFGLERTYADAEELLSREKPDLVSICTWPPYHADLTIAACDAGARAVLCEKPIAVHLADADRMIETARARGTLLCINHQRRFTPRYVAAREYIDAGAIGLVTHVAAICGGDLLTDGTHLIDLTRYLVGELPIEWVFGGLERTKRRNVDPVRGMGFAEWYTTGKRYGHHVEGGALALIQFQGGVRASLEIGNVARPAYQKFVVDGLDGRVEVSGDRRIPGEPELRILQAQGGATVPKLGPNRAMAANVEAIVGSLESGAPHTLGAESARATLEAIVAIYESALDRRRVDLPFERPDSPLEAAVDSGVFTYA
ncbi:MAG TPA: Gfo/Idh/MocA family oxidoreductase [Chloroflexota bacterium]|nr:Gfo/Idh/MocA family oxidoreductase [Chloroflexota bacterium]